MRAGTNSHIPVFGRCATPLALLATPSLHRYAARSVKQWCLAPAFGCDARRALRRVVALERASMRCDSAFPFHPTTSQCSRFAVLAALPDRKRVVVGTSVSVRVDSGG